MLPAPRLAEQLSQHRPQVLVYLPSSVTPDGQWHFAPNTVQVDETTMIHGLNTFLEHAAAAADAQGDKEGAQRAQKAREQVSFIGAHEFGQAASGIADYWHRFLQEDPDNQLVVFSPKLSRPYKSADFVTDAVTNNLKAQDPEVAESGRIHFADQDLSFLHGSDPSKTKIVLVDDWVSSGAMMRSDARGVAAELRRAGLDSFVDRIEANLLVVKEEHLDEPLQFISNEKTGERRELPTQAYFVAASQEDAGMHVFGAHSSVDHNDSYLRSLAEQQAQVTGQEVRLPEAALIQRPYRALEAPLAVLENSQQ